jgi:hypothetical protein
MRLNMEGIESLKAIIAKEKKMLNELNSLENYRRKQNLRKRR